MKLNLGSGYRNKEGYINIDINEQCKPDVVLDITQGLPYDDSTIDEVRAWDILEHIPIGKTVPLIEEIWRVLKPGGLLESFTPDAEYGQAAFQDPTHVSFWVENSWLYYSHPDYRKLYDIRAEFWPIDIERIVMDKKLRVVNLHVKAIAKK